MPAKTKSLACCTASVIERSVAKSAAMAADNVQPAPFVVCLGDFGVSKRKSHPHHRAGRRLAARSDERHL